MSKSQTTNLSQEELLALYRQMYVIRTVEEALGAASKSGDLPGPVHLYVGQEAVAVGVCAHLKDEDWITSTHRGHGHFVAKGGDVRALIDEVFGRASGICGGMGGSMHVADFSKGIVGANGIVGAGIPLAVGAALTAQVTRPGTVAVSFFGDGASNQGALMEAFNISALWKLPIVFICENNGFSEFSPTTTVTAGEIAKRAEPFGIPAVAVDGNDLVNMWQAASVAVRRAREGGGPTLIEAKTYRLRGHVEYEHTFLSKPYRTQEELNDRTQSDPIGRMKAVLLATINPDTVMQMESTVRTDVDAFIREAKEAPWPHPDGAQTAAFV